VKPGLVYALGLVIFVLVLVILLQQRKLGAVREENASLRGDTRALITTRNTENAAATDVQRENRQLRSENEQLRKDLQTLREQAPARSPE